MARVGRSVPNRPIVRRAPQPPPPVVTYYVSAAGNDSNNGTTTGTPWASISKVNAAVLNPGDTVLFRGGDTFSGQIAPTIAGSPSAGFPVTFGSYSTGRATIFNNTGGYGFYFTDAGGIVVQDLVVWGGGSSYNTGAGIGFYRSTGGRAAYLRILRCDTAYFRNGIEIGGASAGGGYSDVRVEDCVSYENRDNGLAMYGPTWVNGTPGYAHANVTVTGCEFRTTYGDPGNTTTNSGSGCVLGSVDGALIELSSAHGNGQYCTAPQGPAGIWVYDANAAVIEQCVSYGNLTGGTADGDGFDLDINVTNSTIRRCLSYSNAGAGILLYASAANNDWSGNTVHDNVTWGNSLIHAYYAELKIAGNAGASGIYHNTLVATADSLGAVVSVEDAGAAGITVRNTILQQDGPGAVVETGATLDATDVLFQGNWYWDGTGATIDWNGVTYTTLAGWRAAVAGQEEVTGTPVGRIADPQMLNPVDTVVVTDPSSRSGANGMRVQSRAPSAIQALDLPTLFGVVLGNDFSDDGRRFPYSVGANEATPRFDAIQDPFDALDLNHWPANYGSPTVTGGRGRVPCVAGVYAAFQSAEDFQFTGSKISVRVYPPAVGGGIDVYAEVILAEANQPAGTNITVQVDVAEVGGAVLRLRSNVGYSDAGEVLLTYDPVAHAYVRLAEDAGTLTWETSPNGTTWTVRRSVSTPSWLLSSGECNVYLQAHRDAGTSDYAEFDDFNAVSGDASVAVGAASETNTAAAVGRAKAKAAGSASSSESAQGVGRSKSRVTGQATSAESATAVGRRKSRTAGQAAESSTANAAGKSKRRTLASQPSETDTAQVVGRAKAKTTGVASSADVAQPFTVYRHRRITLGLAAETSTAQALAKAKVRATGRATETDTAAAAGRAKARTVGQASTTDTVRPVTVHRLRRIAVGRASETDTGRVLTPTKALEPGIAAEANSARAITWVKVKAAGRAVELDEALPVGRARTYLLGRASETSTAFAAGRSKAVPVGRAAEVDSVFPVSAPGKVTAPVAQVTETDTAHPMAAAKTLPVGRAVEADTALAIRAERRRLTQQASETGTARPLGRAKSVPVGRVSEASTANALYGPGQRIPLGTAADSGSAFAVSRRKSRAVGRASEISIEVPITWSRARSVGRASEVSSARPIGRTKTRPVGRASEASTARPVAQPIRKVLGRAIESSTAWSMTVETGAGGPLRPATLLVAAETDAVYLRATSGEPLLLATSR